MLAICLLIFQSATYWRQIPPPKKIRRIKKKDDISGQTWGCLYSRSFLHWICPTCPLLKNEQISHWCLCLLTKMLNFGLIGTVRALHAVRQWGFPSLKFRWTDTCDISKLNFQLWTRPPSSCLQWALITVWQFQQMMKACLEMIEVYSSFALVCRETGPSNFNSIILDLINQHRSPSLSHTHTLSPLWKHFNHHV